MSQHGMLHKPKHKGNHNAPTQGWKSALQQVNFRVELFAGNTVGMASTGRGFDQIAVLQCKHAVHPAPSTASLCVRGLKSTGLHALEHRLHQKPRSPLVLCHDVQA